TACCARRRTKPPSPSARCGTSPARPTAAAAGCSPASSRSPDGRHPGARHPMSRVPLPMAQVALSAMNHVLQQQPASRERMRAHAGCCIRIVASHPFGALESDAMVGPDGLLVAIARGTPDVVLRIAPRVDGLLRVLDEGTRALRSQLSIEGDAALAATVSEVADALEWDFEEDLSRVVGDPIAHRVGLAVRGLRARFGGLRSEEHTSELQS